MPPVMVISQGAGVGAVPPMRSVMVRLTPSLFSPLFLSSSSFPSHAPTLLHPLPLLRCFNIVILSILIEILKRMFLNLDDKNSVVSGTPEELVDNVLKETFIGTGMLPSHMK